MSKVVRFELDDGTSALVEVASSGEFVEPYGGDAGPIEGGALSAKLVGAARTAQTIARAMREQLSPDELTLELGLKVSGETHWFVAKAQSEGTVKVTLKWKGAAPEAR